MPRPRTVSQRILTARATPAPFKALAADEWGLRRMKIRNSAACFAAMRMRLGALDASDPWDARRLAVLWLEGV